ncbi:MAG: hypothetical protein R3D85_01275 [Paracoccaceae bacterium]
MMIAKNWQAEPLIYLAVVLGLLALRRTGRRRVKATGAPRSSYI